jgi:hypothetical protein
MVTKQEIRHSCSMLDTYSQCRRKFYWGYIKRLVPVRSNWYIVRGNAVHVALEAYYTSKSHDIGAAVDAGLALVANERSTNKFLSPEDEFELDKIGALVRGFLPAYAQFHGRPELSLAIEAVFERVRIGGFLFDGIIDRITIKDNIISIVDHKTKSWLTGDTLAVLPLQYQTVLYPAAASIIAGKTVRQMVYNYVQIPSLRQGIRETVEAFLRRFEQAFGSDPSKYFHRETINVDNASLQKKLMTNITEVCREIGQLAARPRLSSWYRCPSSCAQFGKACEYLPLCINGERQDVMLGYKAKPEKEEGAHE